METAGNWPVSLYRSARRGLPVSVQFQHGLRVALRQNAEIGQASRAQGYSRNRKTGPIPVSTTSANSCPPTCGFNGNGCYAESGPLAIHWKCVSEGRRGYSFDELLQEIATLRRHALWRHNQAGDLTPEAPGVIDSRRLTRLANATRPSLASTALRWAPSRRTSKAWLQSWARRHERRWPASRWKRGSWMSLNSRAEDPGGRPPLR